MSFTEPQDTTEPQTDDESPKKLRRQLAKQAAEMADLQAKLEQQSRELAFKSVGLPDNPMSQFFRDNYKGDTSEDAVRAAATELGLLVPDAATQQMVGEIEAQSDLAAAAQSVLPQDVREQMEAEMAKVRPGQNAAYEIQAILQKYGRPTGADMT